MATFFLVVVKHEIYNSRFMCVQSICLVFLDYHFLRSDLWIVIENVSDRLTKIDKVPFMTQDVVQKLKTYFQDIRLASGK